MNKEQIEKIARRHFPKATPNPGQMEAIVDVVSSILSGKHHVILSAPTGCGKSVIATTVHRTLKEIKGTWRSTIITSTKGLQDQYTQDDREIFDLRSKTNYSCPKGAGHYGSSQCKMLLASNGCERASICPYLKKRNYWSNSAQLRITNSSFQISAGEMICIEDENKADMIVVDECHEIDDIIVEHTTIVIDVEDTALFRKYGAKTLPKMISNFVESFTLVDLGKVMQFSDDELNFINAISSELSLFISSMEELLLDKTRDDHEAIIDVIERASGISSACSLAITAAKGTWILNEKAIGKIVFKPVYAWQVANFALFRKAEYFLHMSATICGYEEYMKNLGIEESDASIIEVENSIPLKNRRVYIIPTQKVSGNFDIKKLSNDIDTLIKRHKGENGIIHTVSFKLAKDIYENSNHQNKMLVSGDRSEILDFMSKKDGRILLSPSIVKGYDFKGDLSRFQILAKCPFPFLGDPLIALNSKERPDWYARKTILSLVQSCGRSVRGVDDYAATYIVDSNFMRLLRDNVEIFPEWFLDSLKIVE